MRSCLFFLLVLGSTSALAENQAPRVLGVKSADAAAPVHMRDAAGNYYEYAMIRFPVQQDAAFKVKVTKSQLANCKIQSKTFAFNYADVLVTFAPELEDGVNSCRVTALSGDTIINVDLAIQVSN
jgi:hypothetical protein